MSILTLILALPLLGAAVIALLPKNAASAIRNTALGSAGLAMLLAVLAFVLYPGAEIGAGGYRFHQKVMWISSLDISYQVGADGVNVGLILMAALVGFTAVCVSGDIEKRLKEFHFLLLIMLAGVLGAFMSVDVFFFYFFHELALVPTFIMMGVWGRGERRTFATYQITLYLTAGALAALVGLTLLYTQSGAGSFDLVTLQQHVADNPIPAGQQTAIFGFLLLGFGILVSLWPFHSWAPPGYGVAPTATAMIHAGALKKFGLYGLIRVALPLVPEGAQSWVHLMAWLCLGNLLYCGWVAMRQKAAVIASASSSVPHK